MPDPDSLRGWLDYGVPFTLLGLLVYGIHRYFLSPLGGKDGIVATFFVTQTECMRKQTALFEKHNEAADRMAASLANLNTSHAAFASQSSEFEHQASVELRDLLYSHSRLAYAMSLEFESEEARRVLREVDDIMKRYIPSTGPWKRQST